MTGREWIVSRAEPVLVTGAAGFIGARVVRMLCEYGFQHIRCFVRPSSTLNASQSLREGRDGTATLEVIEGNLLSRQDCRRAAAGVSVVLHLAAGTGRSFAGCVMDSVVATRNLVDALLAEKTLKRFVNVSSFAVYSNFDMARGSLLDEAAPLESDPAGRGDAYAYGKLKQDRLLVRYADECGLPYVSVRPGVVFGPGRTELTGRIGTGAFGVFLHLGGSNRIPFTYVDNCAEAIVLAGLVRGVEGEVFNIVDDDLPTSRAFLRMYKRECGGFLSVPVPYPLAYLLCSLWERHSTRSGGQLPDRFNRRRCSVEWRGNRYSNEKLTRLLGWRPRVSFDEASTLFFDAVRGGD